MATQVRNGKAFEYALINETYNILLAKGFNVTIIQDSSYKGCLVFYNSFPISEQTRYSLGAQGAINHIITLEPRLVTPANQNDILTLQLLPDSAGKAGDVRDLLFIRSTQNWEIGISAKNNHNALKHSRLSNVLDFGNSWFGIPCSPQYFSNVNAIFDQLTSYILDKTKWNVVQNKSANIYIPILGAFINELSIINADNSDIPKALLSYLIGRNDFYKVIRGKKTIEINAFNLYGTLGKNSGSIKSITNIPRLALPHQIIQLQVIPNRVGALSMICDQGWQLNFRIHSADEFVNKSLKFDVRLIGKPNGLYTHHIAY